MREIIELMQRPVAGSPLWLWVLAGIAVGAALTGYAGGGDGACGFLMGGIAC